MATTTTQDDLEQEWLRAYALLALRIERQVAERTSTPLLDYRGPAEWREQVANEEPLPPGQLVDEADRLLDDLPFDPERAAFLAAHTRALRTIARRLDGESPPLQDYVHQCLGIEPQWLPETLFEATHAQLDAALPTTTGTTGTEGATASVAARFHAWQQAHSLPPQQMGRLPELVARAVAEARARTRALVPLPHDEEVSCELVSGVHFHAAGAHHGGPRSTIFVNRDRPYNLADLLYDVTHEGHPGHIAESVLKEILLVDRQGRIEQQVRFLVSPQFVISEGLGLHAQSLIFPDDEAQAWLTDNILTELGIPPDGSDFAAIHEAKNILWGAWSNAALLLADGCPDGEVKDYLARWGLLSEADLSALGPTLSMLKVPFAEPYIFCYYHGWQLLRPWLASDPHTQARRLLTEQLLPTHLDTTVPVGRDVR